MQCYQNVSRSGKQTRQKNTVLTKSRNATRMSQGRGSKPDQKKPACHSLMQKKNATRMTQASQLRKAVLSQREKKTTVNVTKSCYATRIYQAKEVGKASNPKVIEIPEIRNESKLPSRGRKSTEALDRNACVCLSNKSIAPALRCLAPRDTAGVTETTLTTVHHVAEAGLTTTVRTLTWIRCT